MKYISRLLLVFCFVVSLGCFSVWGPASSIAADDAEVSIILSRVNAFKEFEAEEVINYSQIDVFLGEAQDNLNTWQQKFQLISMAERSSLASPVQRKRLKVRLANLRRSTDEVVDDLVQARDDCSARIEILSSFTRSSIGVGSDVPEPVRELLSSSYKEIKTLKLDSDKQLQKIDLLLKVANRLQGRINKVDQGEKNSLVQLWSEWLLAGKEPVLQLISGRKLPLRVPGYS